MSPPPWTLFCPRSGLIPDPYLPTWPVSSARLMSEKTLSTALWCSVIPSVQQICARSALPYACASSRIASAGTPVTRSASSSVHGSTDARNSSKPVVARSTNSMSASPAWMISRATAFASGMSVPTSMPSQRSPTARTASAAGRRPSASRPGGPPSARGGRRSDAPRARSSPRGGSGPRCGPPRRSSSRRLHRTPSPDRRRWARVRFGCSCRCCWSPGRPGRTSAWRSSARSWPWSS